MNLFKNHEMLVLIVLLLLLPTVFYLVISDNNLGQTTHLPVIQKPINSINPDLNPELPIQEPSENCAVQGCHGTSIRCGPQQNMMCTEVYMMGDGCRNIASCEATSNGCILSNQDVVDRCVSCVEDCKQSDVQDQFKCERACVEQAQ